MVIFYIIIILALFLRLIGLENITLGDEGYSLFIAKSPNFFSIFQDAGNPWFYYLILKFLNFLNFNILSYKLISILFNILSITFLWVILKKKFNIKYANIGAFLAAINPVMLYYSHEIRCYSFLMMLSPLIIFYFFQMLQKRKNTDFVIYGLLALIAINTHYYMTLFLFSNFIFGLIYLRKRKTALIKYIFVNLAVLFSFLPFFFICTYKNAILTGFNNTFENISSTLLKKQIFFIFSGFISLIFSIFFFIKSIFSKLANYKIKLWLSYTFYTIFCIFILSIAISKLIRPIIIERYFSFLIPVFIIFLAIIFNLYKKKLYTAIFLIWLISIQYSSAIKDMRPLYRFEQNIFQIAKNSNNTYIIIRPITKYYALINGFDKMNIIVFNVQNKKELQENIKNEITKILNNNKNAVIYTVLLEPNKNTKNYKCYYNKELDLCLWEIRN